MGITIDEAIKHAREVEERKKKAFQNCEDDCRFCLASKPCNGIAEEHEQLAEWLEELKANKVTSAEIYEDGYKRGYSNGYNNAIDDFVGVALQKLTELELRDSLATVTNCKLVLRDTAEQLKEGGKND